MTEDASKEETTAGWESPPSAGAAFPSLQEIPFHGELSHNTSAKWPHRSVMAAPRRRAKKGENPLIPSATPSSPTGEDTHRPIPAEGKRAPEAYNFGHFRTRHLLEDAKRTLEKEGVLPGEKVPDFEHPSADGGTLRFSDPSGKPVLLRFGSPT